MALAELLGFVAGADRTQMLAEQLGLEDDELRHYLRDEIRRRRRERGDAWAQLDETLAKRAKSV